MKNTLALLIVSFLLLPACNFSDLGNSHNDPSPEFPPETQTGANTFACRVNGEIWTYKPSSNPGHISLGADYNGDKMYVYANGKGGAFIKIDLTSVGGVTHLGEYDLYQNGRRLAYYDHLENGTYKTDSLTNGILTMTRLDTANSIVSDRFHFNAINHLGDTVRITDGRFDVKYRYP